jgi:hypothetical protein
LVEGVHVVADYVLPFCAFGLSLSFDERKQASEHVSPALDFGNAQGRQDVLEAAQILEVTEAETAREDILFPEFNTFNNKNYRDVNIGRPSVKARVTHNDV